MMKAQASRGADFHEISFVQKGKMVMTLMVPVIVSAFRRAEEPGPGDGGPGICAACAAHVAAHAHMADAGHAVHRVVPRLAALHIVVVINRLLITTTFIFTVC